MPTRPLRVLMTTDAVGGVWSYTKGLCASLPEIEFVVAVMGPRPRTQQRTAIARLGNVLLVESDFRLEWMPGGVGDLTASRCWLEGLAERHDVDLVHVNGYAHASLATRAPALCVAHSDVLSWWQAVHHRAAPPEWDRYRRDVKEGLAAATRIVAPTAATLDDIERQYGPLAAPAEVIANGIDLAEFRPLPKRPVVFAAGRVWDAAKNLALLDVAASDLRWQVEIAGDSHHPAAGSVQLRHARVLGRLDAAEMSRRLRRAALFAAPARYEPFGLAILEAAAAGCALVLGDIPSLRENWDGAAVFVDPDDEPLWRRTLSRLIADPPARSHLAAAAHRRARRFSLATMAQAYRRLYRELADAGTAPIMVIPAPPVAEIEPAAR